MAQVQSGPLEGMCILLVEDEAIIGLDLRKCLQSSGAQVTGPVPTLVKALAASETLTFDCAILDLKIIGGDIAPVADLLCEKGVPIVFHTGHGQTEELKRQWPGCEVLVKPGDFAGLPVMLNRIVDRCG